MKHIKRDFQSKACVSPPRWTKGVGSKGHMNLKGITNAAAWLQIFCSQTPTHHLTLGLESKCQNSFFTEHGHVAYEIKRITNAATW